MTQCQLLLAALKRGERLTTLDALNLYGVMALSQRMTDLRADGVPVESETVTLPSGKRVARYFLRQLELA